MTAQPHLFAVRLRRGLARNDNLPAELEQLECHLGALQAAELRGYFAGVRAAIDAGADTWTVVSLVDEVAVERFPALTGCLLGPEQRAELEAALATCGEHHRRLRGQAE